ncbi:MFS transporter [Chloroflexota bacterium]
MTEGRPAQRNNLPPFETPQVLEGDDRILCPLYTTLNGVSIERCVDVLTSKEPLQTKTGLRNTFHLIYRVMHLNQKPPRVFYGWWIVAASFFVSLYVGGVVGYSFTAIFQPIADEFGWSYTQISLAASLRGLEAGILAPLVGLVVDRWGPRRLMFAGSAIICLGLIVLSRTTSLGMFYAAYALMAIGVSGCSFTVLMTAVSRWFRKRAGIAFGIVSSGHGFSGLLIPVVVRLIDVYEWRMAMAILAVGMLLLGLPLSLLVRHKPEQYGYQIDGEVNTDEGLVRVQAVEVGVTAKQAIKSRAFWHIALAMACMFMIVTAVISHVMPYLSSIRVARVTSGLVASALPLLSIPGRLSFGWLADRFDKRRVIAVGFAIVSLGMLLFAYLEIGGMWLLVPFVILFGIGWGGVFVMRMAMLREYFGRSRFGTIHGFMTAVIMLGQILGPPLAGLTFDKWGSYQCIWLVFAGLAVLGLFITATTPTTRNTIQYGRLTNQRA